MGKDKKPAPPATVLTPAVVKLKPATHIKVRHILCEKHGKATEALLKVTEGERFDKVAVLYSEDRAKTGGDLGWKERAALDKPFSEAAFALEVSTTDRVCSRLLYTHYRYMQDSIHTLIRDPRGFGKIAQLTPCTHQPIMSPLIKTVHGYHIIMVEGRK